MSATVELLEALVGFDTTSRNSNLELIRFIEDRLTGLPVTLLPSADGTKASLVARIGPAAPGGVVLCGHTDVVPVDGQPWTVPGFTLTESDQRYYGRGTTDMKGFLAGVLAAIPSLRDADLRRPAWLALTYDEEVGCLAAGELASFLVKADVRPELVITGEPTSMAVVRAHKGVRVIRTTVTGQEAHSSRTDLGVSAIEAGAALVGELYRIGSELASGPLVPGFQPGFTTVNVGVIAGGSALNIVARECGFTWEYRTPPGLDPELVLDAARRFGLPAGASAQFEVIADVPALDPSGNAEAAALLAGLAGLEQEPAVAYGTDGAALAGAGLPTVVCGPGSMAQGHRPDEFVTGEQLAACDAMMADLVGWLSS